MREGRALAGCLARRLSAWILAIGTPISMVFSNRSSAAVLGAAVGMLLVAMWLSRERMPYEGFRAVSRRNAKSWLLKHPFLVVFLLFLLAAMAGLPFTANPSFHRWRLLEFITPVLLIALMLRCLQSTRLPADFPALVFGLVFASMLTLVELRNGAPMRGYFGLRLEDYRLNRTAIMLLILLFPLLAYALARPERRWTAAFAAMLPLMAIFQSESGSAMFGFLVGLCAFALALISWRFAYNLVGVGMLAGISTAPWHGIILTDLLTEAMHQHLRSMSSAIRVEIYRAFGWAVEYAPFLGSGFNTASQLEREPAFRAIPAKLSHFLEFGHAHNAVLQVWVEFGLFGAVLLMALTLLTLRQIEASPPVIRPVLLAFLAAAFAIALVSHGAWQAWWAGALGVGIVLLVSIRQDILARPASPKRV